MNRLIKKLKHNILYNRIEYPMLYVVKDTSSTSLKELKEVFKQSDIISLSEITKLNKKYHSIVLEEVDTFSLELLKLMKAESSLYFFSNKYEELKEELSRYFKYVDSHHFELGLSFTPVSPKERTEFRGDGRLQLNVLTASNHQAIHLNHTTKIDFDVLNRHINQFFVPMDLFLKEKELKIEFQEKAKSLKEKEYFLLQKHKMIKKAVKDLLKKNTLDTQKLDQLKVKLEEYKSLFLSFLTINQHEESPDYFSDILYLENIIQKNIEYIEQEVALTKEVLQVRNQKNSTLFSLHLDDKKSKEEAKKVYEENNELITQNNLYVSEIAHLKFDLQEVNNEKSELIKTIEEFEMQLSQVEQEKEEYGEAVLKDLKAKHELVLKEEAIKQEESLKHSKELEVTLSKLKQKNLDLKSSIDEKNVSIQKLNMNLDKLSEEFELKEELLNKKNLMIREKENKIAMLEDDIKNKDFIYENLKQEAVENSKKMNSNYYKQLYDNLEQEYHKLKAKYQDTINLNKDYKTEIEQYEIKLQELIGYNERITKEIEIDLDDF